MATGTVNMTATARRSVPAYAQQLAAQAEAIVDAALKAGAVDAEVVVREGDEFDATVRMGELETLKDSGSRGVGLRVFLASDKGKRVGSTSSSDLTPTGVAHLVAGAIALARISSPDPRAPRALRTAGFRRCRSPQERMARCSATAGVRAREHWRSSNRRRQ